MCLSVSEGDQRDYRVLRVYMCRRDYMWMYVCVGFITPITRPTGMW